MPESSQPEEKHQENQPDSSSNSEDDKGLEEKEKPQNSIEVVEGEQQDSQSKPQESPQTTIETAPQTTIPTAAQTNDEAKTPIDEPPATSVLDQNEISPKKSEENPPTNSPNLPETTTHNEPPVPAPTKPLETTEATKPHSTLITTIEEIPKKTDEPIETPVTTISTQTESDIQTTKLTETVVTNAPTEPSLPEPTQPKQATEESKVDSSSNSDADKANEEKGIDVAQIEQQDSQSNSQDSLPHSTSPTILDQIESSCNKSVENAADATSDTQTNAPNESTSSVQPQLESSENGEIDSVPKTDANTEAKTSEVVPTTERPPELAPQTEAPQEAIPQTEAPQEVISATEKAQEIVPPTEKPQEIVPPTEKSQNADSPIDRMDKSEETIIYVLPTTTKATEESVNLSDQLQPTISSENQPIATTVTIAESINIILMTPTTPIANNDYEHTQETTASKASDHPEQHVIIQQNTENPIENQNIPEVSNDLSDVADTTSLTPQSSGDDINEPISDNSIENNIDDANGNFASRIAINLKLILSLFYLILVFNTNLKYLH